MHVLLFRTPASGDTYTPALAAAGYTSTSLPALEDTLLPSALAPVLARGGAEWEAAIVTSRRAAEAWVLAAQSVVEDGHVTCEEPWSAVPVWSPGPAVSSVLARAELPPALLPSPAPTAVSAAALAPLILAAPPRSQPSEAGGYRPYLVLTGDKTLPLLTDALRGAGRTVERVRVYETREAAGLGEAVRALPRGGEGAWVVFFSPSSAGFVLPHLETAGFCLKAGEEGGRRTRVAAIGETTEAALRAVRE